MRIEDQPSFLDRVRNSILDYSVQILLDFDIRFRDT